MTRYNVTVPVEYTRNGQTQRRFTKVGAAFVNTRKDTGEEFLSIKLDFPIGATELVGWWADPDFDPELPAFYYLRALEIPTPRWTAYDAKYFGIELPDEVPTITVERAYTSPIWYSPASG